METSETIGCRMYMAEDELFLASRNLAADLHELERTISGLRSRMHQRLCRNPGHPVHEQARDILSDVSAVLGSIDMTGLRRQTRQVEELTARVDEFQGQMSGDGGREALAAVA